MKRTAAIIGSIAILILAGILARAACISRAEAEGCEIDGHGTECCGNAGSKGSTCGEVECFEESADQMKATRYDTGIDPDSPPHITVSKSVSKDEIWHSGDYRGPRNTTVTLGISGEGNPAIDFNSQDVVFTIDCSDSMNHADSGWKRREAAKSYVDQLIPPDRAAVIRFAETAELMRGHHLSSDYGRIKGDLDKLDNLNRTNFGAAIELTNREFAQHGDQNKSLICILLTDGKPDPADTNVTQDVINETIGLNITVYTIGLYYAHTSSLIDEDLLRWIARKTGGEYFIAHEPEDLVSIYDGIAQRFRNYTAGYDPDDEDGEPMIRDVVAQGINIDNDSFSIPPAAIYEGVANLTILEWNVSMLEIGESMEVTYNISSSLRGSVSLHPYGVPRLMYYLGGERYEVYIPQINIWVLATLRGAIVPPPPPPPPPPVPPPPPPGGYPIPITTPASPTVVPLTTPTGLPAAATPAVFPIEYMIAGFVGLGILERIKLKKLLVSRQKVAVGT